MVNNTLISIHTTDFPWRFLLSIGLFALGGTMWTEWVQEPGQNEPGELLAILGLSLLCLTLALLFKPHKVEISTEAEGRTIRVRQHILFSLRRERVFTCLPQDVLCYDIPTTPEVGLFSSFDRGGSICLLHQGKKTTLYTHMVSEFECRRVYEFLAARVVCTVLPFTR